jgi:hypothetical protein
MIGVMVRQKEPGYIGKGYAELIQTLHRTASGVKDELFRSGFDQSARSKAVQDRRRRAGAEQGNAKKIGI